MLVIIGGFLPCFFQGGREGEEVWAFGKAAIGNQLLSFNRVINLL